MRRVPISHNCRASLAFTLLEIMMAVFILAVAAGILMGTQSTSMRLIGYANNLSIVTLLTRAKMQDVEYQMQKEAEKEGIKKGYEQTYSGNYADEGYQDITWEAHIESIELKDDASNGLVESVKQQLYGIGDKSGSLSGNTAFTRFLPTMVGYMPQIINQLGQRIRRITLTTGWTYLGVEQTMTVSQYSVSLNVDASSEASGSSASKSEPDS